MQLVSRAGRVARHGFTMVLILVLIACSSAAPAAGDPTTRATGGPTLAVTAAPTRDTATAGPIQTAPATSMASSALATVAPSSSASHVGGRITWDAVTTSPVSQDEVQVITVSGTADVVLLAERSYGFTAERGGGSTYAYDYSISDCTPTAHPTGTLETATQLQPAGSTIAQMLIQGAPGQDLSIALNFNDQWEATCSGLTSTWETTPGSFPGCGPQGWVDATFDEVDSYSVDCDSAATFDKITVTGHVKGTLSPID